MHAHHDAGGVPAEVQAAWLHHRFTQIHPFQDGNGRLARAIASSVLIKHELFPLVVTRDDRTVYLDALEAADGGALKPLVDLIAKLQRVQFVRAADMSETVLSESATVSATLDGLIDAAARRATERRERHERVFRLAAGLTEDLKERLESISPDVTKALRRVTPSGESRVRVGEESTGHYYRSQIVENARHHLDYFANLADFRSWVALDMRWERRARLVFRDPRRRTPIQRKPDLRALSRVSRQGRRCGDTLHARAGFGRRFHLLLQRNERDGPEEVPPLGASVCSRPPSTS